MNNRKLTNILLIILIIGAGILMYGVYRNPEEKVLVEQSEQGTTSAEVGNMGYGYYANQPTQKSTKKEITNVAIQNRKLWIIGTNLASVKVYGVPTGTGVTEGKYLGDATLDFSNPNTGIQEWFFVPREEQLLLTSIYAVGYDDGGTQVGTKTAAETGASAIYEAFNR